LGRRRRALEGLAVSGPTRSFWTGKRVFLTGQTGFKGSWLALWLNELGARIDGFALPPVTTPSLYEVVGVERLVHRSTISDIRDLEALVGALEGADPEIIVHMAAQSLVRASYREPLETLAVNVIGTANVLQAARRCQRLRAVIVVTSDKCYENSEGHRPYQESDPLGGRDPYSASKACAEIVTAAYARSFLWRREGSVGGPVAVASARAGNVIGGGDWSEDRLVPDFFRARDAGCPLRLRRPEAVRPWQHVLEPLSGYLILAERLLSDQGEDFAGAWNFGPDPAACWPVAAVADRLVALCGGAVRCEPDRDVHLPEAGFLSLDSDKARRMLEWHPRWSVDEALARTVAWRDAYQKGADMAAICRAEIAAYCEAIADVPQYAY
jgi:CDP-glucose 4,6-dehydratase